MAITNLPEAQTHLAKLLEDALAGKEVIIGKDGQPLAKLVPFQRDSSPRNLEQGIWKDKVWMAEDFNTSSRPLWPFAYSAGNT
jgi:antitoxin (DNA-binding transcriptional repressor) of toxin-antitoxin stability system